MRGIFFTPEMIRAIEEGKKTVTRRLDGLKEVNKEPDKWRLCNPTTFIFCSDKVSEMVKPRYQVGEVVYIKEVWRPYSENEVRIEYKFDGAIIDYPSKPRGYFYGCGEAWRFPRFMPAWIARYFIKILSVKAERLWEIEKHPEDYKAEGYVPIVLDNSAIDGKPFEASLDFAWFENLWNSINKNQKWDTNPFVWRYSFEKVASSAMNADEA